VKRKDIIDEHFILTIHDLVNGAEPEHIEAIIQAYEDAEEYEICSGMNKALKLFKESYNGSKGIKNTD
jgi:hypothetical protein